MRFGLEPGYSRGSLHIFRRSMDLGLKLFFSSGTLHIIWRSRDPGLELICSSGTLHIIWRFRDPGLELVCSWGTTYGVNGPLSCLLGQSTEVSVTDRELVVSKGKVSNRRFPFMY